MATRISITTGPGNTLHLRGGQLAVKCDDHGAATPRKVRREFYRRHGHVTMTAAEAAPLVVAVRDELRGER